MYLLQKVGTDMETLSTEIEKLICYCMKTDVVDKDAIDAVCVTVCLRFRGRSLI